MYLLESVSRRISHQIDNEQMQSIYQYEFGDENCSPLEVDSLPAVIVQVLNLKHGSICILGGLRHGPLERGEERGIVESPF